MDMVDVLRFLRVRFSNKQIYFKLCFFFLFLMSVKFWNQSLQVGRGYPCWGLEEGGGNSSQIFVRIVWEGQSSVENSAKSLPVCRTGDLYYLPTLPKSCPPTHWFYIKILAIHENLPVRRTGWVSYLPAHFLPGIGRADGLYFQHWSKPKFPPPHPSYHMDGKSASRERYGNCISFV